MPSALCIFSASCKLAFRLVALYVSSIEIEKDRGSTEAICHYLKRVTFELTDLQRRSQLSVVFGTEKLWHLSCCIIFIPYCAAITF